MRYYPASTSNIPEKDYIIHIPKQRNTLILGFIKKGGHCLTGFTFISREMKRLSIEIFKTQNQECFASKESRHKKMTRKQFCN